MEQEKKRELIEKKANHYSKEAKIIHITLDNGRFYNGKIKYIGIDFLLFEDRKLGDIAIYFIEILDIFPYEEGK